MTRAARGPCAAGRSTFAPAARPACAASASTASTSTTSTALTPQLPSRRRLASSRSWWRRVRSSTSDCQRRARTPSGVHMLCTRSPRCRWSGLSGLATLSPKLCRSAGDSWIADSFVPAHEALTALFGYSSITSIHID
ncbi:Putative oxidoreductase, aldo/keto reductase family protein [Zea mays]|uniref:Putative oxidoreductase, aldo/keto reductase family protein n=1 Tax=Zea mays TaxID=4577 RepID=A0A1D6FZG2_MAIZE|nr:Putative oxidoreductase, aldo/keto reductase family protein [Zea mays]